MTIELTNVFVNPKFSGHRHINLKYCANHVEIFDTHNNKICEMGVTKFLADSNEVLFYFVHNGEICQFLNGHISTNKRTFEKSFCKYDEQELFTIAKEIPSTYK